jgi:hypothetical protein
MLTEEQAQSKWCPFARVASVAVNGDAVSANRMTRMDDECNCIGSACMAWRWGSYSFGDQGPMPGYCGLAGKGD